MRNAGCAAQRQAARLAERLAQVGNVQRRTDEVLRRQWFEIDGPYLEYRAMPAGTPVKIGAGLVVPGTVCLACSPDGHLAAGVAHYDEAGNLTVWADWSGPPTILCCCGEARVIGPLIRFVEFDPVPPGSLLAWMLGEAADEDEVEGADDWHTKGAVAI